VLSESNKLLDCFPDVDGRMREEYPEIYGEDGLPFWPRVIIVYAQWLPFDKMDAPNIDWFDRLREGSLLDLPVITKPMSQLAGDWLFRNVQEFDHAYVKRAYVTNSRTLAKDGWPKWAAHRVDKIVMPEQNKCWLSAQFQCYGGRNSMFATNSENGTSYSWRDTTLISILDCFYKSGHQHTAEDWQAGNDEGIGETGIFSKKVRRVLWGSHGSYDLDASSSYYYEDKSKYDSLVKTRGVADPDGVFTPNTFSVARK
jgi:hypothetical protein